MSAARWAAVLAVVLCLALLASFPWQDRYHELRRVAGEVMAPPTLNLDGSWSVPLVDGRTYTVDDQRLASLRPGNGLVLLCIDRWRPTVADVTECTFASKWPPS